MLLYAEPDDLQEWLPDGDVPDNAATLLRYASLLVADATSADYYVVDSAGFATDTPTRQAFTDATCAQAVYWAAAGIDPAAGDSALTGPAQAKKVGSASVTYSAQTTAQIQARMDAAGKLCDTAVRVLTLTGLLSSSVWTYG